MQVIRLMILGIASIFILSACDGEQKPQKKNFVSDTNIYKIDKNIGEAKFLFKSFEIGARVSCKLSSETDKKMNIGRYLKKVHDEEKAICTLYHAVEPQISALYIRIEESGIKSSDLFFFKIFLNSLNDKGEPFIEDEFVGLFSTKQDCEKYRKIAINLDIPNKSCTKLSGNPYLE